MADADSSGSGVASGRFPRSITFLAITSLLFSSFSVLGVGFGLLSLLTQSASMETMREMGAGPDGASTPAFEPMFALQERMWGPTLGMNALLGLGAVALGAVGILVLIRHARTPVLGPALLVATAVFAVLAGGFELWIQHISMEAMGGMMGTDPSTGAVGSEITRMLGMMRAFSYGCVGGWLLLKLSFVAWAALHLRSPEIASLFGGPRIPGVRGD